MTYFFKLLITQNVSVVQLFNVKTKNQSRLDLQFMYRKFSSIFIQKKVIRENVDEKVRFLFSLIEILKKSV